MARRNAGPFSGGSWHGFDGSGSCVAMKGTRVAAIREVDRAVRGGPGHGKPYVKNIETGVVWERRGGSWFRVDVPPQKPVQPVDDDAPPHHAWQDRADLA